MLFTEERDETVIAYLRASIQKVMSKQCIHPEWEHYRRDLADAILCCEKLNETIEALGGVREPIRIQYDLKDFKFNQLEKHFEKIDLFKDHVINPYCQCSYCACIKNENSLTQTI